MKIAVIQVRGAVRLNSKHKDTLKMLKLLRKNSCVVLDNNPVSLGMLFKVKDFITWGEIDQKTFKELLEKRARLSGNKSMEESYLKDKIKMGYDDFTKAFFDGKVKLKDVPGMKTYFRLKPPVKGFEKNGIKKPFSLGGALGYRKDDINDLVRRMI